MQRFIGSTLIIFVIVGLTPLLAYSQPTITIQIPSEFFGPPPFTGKTTTLLISSSEDNTEVVSVDLTFAFTPGENLVVTSVQGAGDFAAGWFVSFGDNDKDPLTEGSGVSISAFIGGIGAMVGVTPEPLFTITFDSHPKAGTAPVRVDRDPIHGINQVGFAAFPPVDPTIIPGDMALPVDLSAFTVVPSDLGVTIKWRTESEINNLGFDVYRSESADGPFVKVNLAHIKGAGTDGTPHNYQFVDESAGVGKTYYYYIEAISFSGERERSHIIKVIVDVSGKVKVTGSMQPTTFALLQNFPNPFNPETWIPFQLAQDADVTIYIYNIKGQRVRTIHLGTKPAGFYYTKEQSAHWDGKDEYGQKVSSGVYFYSLTAGTFKATKKLIVVK